jgi:PmbA protein
VIGSDALLSRFDDAIRAGGADEIEFSFSGQERGTSRFANNALTQCMEVAERIVRARVALGRRLGAAQTDDLSLDALRACVRQAADVARAAPEHPDFAGFPAPESPLPAPVEPAADGPDERAGRLAPLFARARAKNLSLAGLAGALSTELCVANSRGLRAHAVCRGAKLEVIASDGDTSGYASGYAPAPAGIDHERLCETACDKAELARGAVPLPPGEYDVVLEPAAVSEICEWLGFTAFSARSMEDGTSFFCGRLGERAMSEALTIADDAAGRGSAPFDAEGVAKRRVVLVERGVPRACVHDTLSAARAGTRSTGHALPLYDDMHEGQAAADLRVEPGDRTLDELIASVDRGLWVTRFHYVNGLLDPPRAMMTGLTRDGLFLIEGGKVRGAVRNLRWTQSVLEAFARIRGVGSEVRAVPTWWSSLGAFSSPAMLVERWTFTGQSR